MTFAYHFGQEMTVAASFMVPDFNRRTNSSQVALGVSSASGPFTTSSAGYIGLLPYTSEELITNEKDENFMRQLQN